MTFQLSFTKLLRASGCSALHGNAPELEATRKFGHDRPQTGWVIKGNDLARVLRSWRKDIVMKERTGGPPTTDQKKGPELVTA